MIRISIAFDVSFARELFHLSTRVRALHGIQRSILYFSTRLFNFLNRSRFLYKQLLKHEFTIIMFRVTFTFENTIFKNIEQCHRKK